MWSRRPKRLFTCGSTDSTCRLARCGKRRGREKRGEFVSGAAKNLHSLDHILEGQQLNLPQLDSRGRQTGTTVSNLTAHIKQAVESNSQARLAHGFHSSGSGAIELPDSSHFLPGLLWRSQHSPPLWKGSAWLILLRRLHLPRVYHIDSNPSSASDSGADFSKAFTVRSFILLSNMLSNLKIKLASHFNVCLVDFKLLLHVGTFFFVSDLKWTPTLMIQNID